MYRILVFFALICFTACGSDNNKPLLKAIKSSHSPDFDAAVYRSLASYHKLTENFVNWDTSALSSSIPALKTDLSEFKTRYLDSSKNIAARSSFEKAMMNLDSMQAASGIENKRRRLDLFSQSYYQFLSNVNYNAHNIYLNECPMAFNDSEPGEWLSDSNGIRNPYLGLKHPRYHKAMIECGSNKDSLLKTIE